MGTDTSTKEQTKGKKHPRGPEVNVNLTADIIATAVRASSSHCMIAEAIKSAVPDAAFVSVDISTCRYTDRKKGYRYVYLTPRTAQIALVGFDEGLAPEPFSFRLRGAHVVRSGRKHRQDKNRPISNTKSVPGEKRTIDRGALKRRLSKASIVVSQTDGVRRVGGQLPPQLHVRREFGMRAFRAATDNRLADHKGAVESTQKA